jgi:hypothetical protein
MAKLPIYLVDEENSEMLVNSIVGSPAHLKKAIKMSKQKPLYLANDEKRIIKGVVLSADQPIYRRDEDGEYYVVFTAKSIRKLAEKYFSEGKYSLLNVEHNGQDSDDLGYLLETYFTEEDSEFNGQPLKAGSWIASYKITSDDLWSEIKTGKFNGFSVEVISDLKPVNFKTQIKMSKETKTVLEKLGDLMKSLAGDEGNFAEITTIDGQTLQYEGDLAVGAMLNIVAEDGTTTLAPEGEYIVEIDGVQKSIKVDAEGVIAAIEDVAQEPASGEMEQLAQSVQALAEVVKEMKSKFAEIEKKVSKFNTTPQTPNNKKIDLFKIKV